MSPTKVGIIGCGIAGPVLAIFLKLKGYDPIVYERYESTADTGLFLSCVTIPCNCPSLILFLDSLQRNGLLVLAKIPGLVEFIDAYPVDEMHFYSTVEEDQGLLGITDYPRKSAASDGLGFRVCPRAKLQRRLAAFAEDAGVPIKWGHRLERLQQNDRSVTATLDRKSTRLNSSHSGESRMPSSA